MHYQFAVVDPRFPKHECQPLKLGREPIIWQDFYRKLLEMNEIGPRGVAGALPTWIRQRFYTAECEACTEISLTI